MCVILVEIQANSCEYAQNWGINLGLRVFFYNERERFVSWPITTCALGRRVVQQGGQIEQVVDRSVRGEFDGLDVGRFPDRSRMKWRRRKSRNFDPGPLTYTDTRITTDGQERTASSHSPPSCTPKSPVCIPQSHFLVTHLRAHYTLSSLYNDFST